ncbi:hypothetical protein HPB52_001328 [Rhipicephalus sanguineus]|uniref:Mutator-like transposase domain-containing protein n=1 Tax=Rhipicephalus sanguineus TaxID=34632 RepID=A0A9D4PHW1_RHISA|nr:hypothetical protein HPB52_001328 [Rhipicephalus sanguineus]
MAIVDSDCQYILIDIGAEGRQSDGGVLKNSKFGKKLLQGTLDLPRAGFLPGTRTVAPYAFVGDEAFQLRKDFTRPFPAKQLTDEKRVFNYRLSRMWKGTLIKEMTEAGEEEKMLAEAAGDFCEDGTTSWITVVVDGGWSHRSHGHRYSANSGVAVIVGKRTQKLLYLGVRNKLCSTCEYYAKKGERKEQSCYRNWDQSSGAMEADILVEGFQRSTEMHGVQYRTFIGDGDSSVYYQLQTRVDYGRFIKKNECANHVVKCYTSRLYSIAKESKGTRSLLSGPRIKRIKNGARKAVSHYAKILRDFEGSEQDLNKEKARLIQELASDIRNGPLHVFGSHDGCKSYFCNGSKGDNLYDGLPKIQQVKLMSAANIIADKADRLITDDTSNLAEAIMSLVAKFAGGKQINRCQRGSYEHRCQGAGLHFQLGPEWHAKASEGITCASGAPILKKYTQKRLNMKRQAISRKRRLLQESGCHFGLPEIVDSRLARSMDVRRTEWNRLAIEAKEKMKNDAASKAKKSRKEKE